VQNNPVNFVDPLGLKGGILIPIRNLIQRNLNWWDITLDPVIETLGISTNPWLILASFYIFPREAGIPNEEVLIRNYSKNPEYQYDLSTFTENPLMWKIKSFGPDKASEDPCLRHR
jgi:hypothetical protein